MNFILNSQYNTNTMTTTRTTTTTNTNRDALIAFYRATNGHGWKNNTNWCSDKPLHTWHGVSTMRRIDEHQPVVVVLALSGNNILGSIPKSLGTLTYLETLYLSKNQLYGFIPTSIGNLPHLERLFVSEPRLFGARVWILQRHRPSFAHTLNVYIVPHSHLLRLTTVRFLFKRCRIECSSKINKKCIYKKSVNKSKQMVIYRPIVILFSNRQRLLWNEHTYPTKTVKTRIFMNPSHLSSFSALLWYMEHTGLG